MMPTLSQLLSASCKGAIFSQTFLTACMGVTCQTGMVDIVLWSVSLELDAIQIVLAVISALEIAI